MLRPLALALAIALAGCSAPWQDGPAAPSAYERLTGACAIPYLNVTPSYPALGETILVEAALVNCGTVPLEIEEPGRCAGTRALSVQVRWEGREFFLEDPSPSALPTSRGTFVGSCGPFAFLEPATLAPGARMAASWPWNGSLASMFSWWTAVGGPFEGQSITTTIEVHPPRAGGYEFSFLFSHAGSNLTWMRSANVYIQDEEEFPAHRRMSAWRADPSAVASGNGTLPDEPPRIVRSAANATLISRGWSDGKHEHLGIAPAGDHYLVRERLDLGAADVTFDVAIPVTADGHPLARPIEGLPDCRELPQECIVSVKAADAARVLESAEAARLIWHTKGERGTFAWEIGGERIDANDGQRL